MRGSSPKIFIESNALKRNCYPQGTAISFLVIISPNYPHNFSGSRKKFQFIC
jgi:hypothetical protein